MSEMIERVARAILDKVPFGYGMTEEESREYAIAAIKALREPDFADMDMLQAMYEAMFADKWDGTQAPMVGAGFDAAIDAILSTQPQEER